MKDEKVIQFDQIVTVIKREETDMPEPTMDVVSDWDEGYRQYCPHEKVVLFTHHRLLKCKKCSAVLDPFDFIFHLAREGNNHISSIKYLRSQLKQIEKDKTDLERIVQNLKAQKRKYQ